MKASIVCRCLPHPFWEVHAHSWLPTDLFEARHVPDVAIRYVCVCMDPGHPLVDPEATKGGLSLDQVHAQLMNAEPEHFTTWNFDAEETPRAQALYDHLFMSDPIDWNRARNPTRANSSPNACPCWTGDGVGALPSLMRRYQPLPMLDLSGRR